jgi:hypothetical protein
MWEMSSAGRRISRDGGFIYGAGAGDELNGFCLFDRMGILKGWDIETSQLLCASRAAIAGVALHWRKELCTSAARIRKADVIILQGATSIVNGKCRSKQLVKISFVARVWLSVFDGTSPWLDGLVSKS